MSPVKVETSSLLAKNVGVLCHQLRMEAGLSEMQLSTVLGWDSIEAIQRIESGHVLPPLTVLDAWFTACSKELHLVAAELEDKK